MNSNRSSNQSRGKANGKNPAKKNQSKPAKAPRGPKQKAVAAAYATGQVGKAPAITMSRDMCRIVHRELIESVTGSVAFTVQRSIAVQPGLAASFPWLSVMAQGWEQYRFRSLKYCYYTRTGSNVPGSVILAPDYDAADAAPATEQIASAFENVAEDAPWKDIECRMTRLSMAAGQTRHFTRSGPLAANLDIKTYDVANLHLCTIDGTAVPWGKLWVEYDVEFFVPQLPPAGAAQFLGGEILGGGVLSAANPLGSVPVLNADASGVSVDAGSIVTFANIGTYLINLRLTGTVITAIPVPTVVGATVIEGGDNVVLASGLEASGTTVLNVTVPGGTADFTATATTITASTLRIALGPTGAYN